MSRAALMVEDGCFVALDVAGRRHRWPIEVPRAIVLQTDRAVGALQLNGSNNILLVLDAEGRTLVCAPRRPFDRAQVVDFCRANGLELRETEVGFSDAGQPPRAPGYASLTVTRRTSWLSGLILIAGVVVGIVGPLPFLAPALAGVVAAFVLLIALS